MNDDEDGFDGEIPDELRPWFESQKEKRRAERESGLVCSILVNGKIKAVSLLEWARWLEDVSNRRIDLTEIPGDEP